MPSVISVPTNRENLGASTYFAGVPYNFHQVICSRERCRTAGHLDNVEKGRSADPNKVIETGRSSFRWQ